MPESQGNVRKPAEGWIPKNHGNPTFGWTPEKLGGAVKRGLVESKGHVCLVNPWIADFAAFDFWIKPLGLLSIGAVLEENGYSVSLLDCMDRNHPEILLAFGGSRGPTKPDGTGPYIKTFLQKPVVLDSVPRRYGLYGLPLPLAAAALRKMPPPDVVLVTSGMTYWYPGVVEAVSLVRRVWPKTPVVLGGIYATLCTDHARRASNADLVVSGEGEIRGLEIVDEITGNRSDTGRYENLDDLPFPLFDLYGRLDSAAVMTSRGCPHRCPFCASALLARRHRRRNPERVLAEIETLVRERGVRRIAFYDDALLFEKEKSILPILDGVVGRRLPVEFFTPNGLPPREIDTPLAQRMKRAGFRMIRLSYESHDPRRQKDMGFKVNDLDLESAVGCLFEAGFDSGSLGAYVLAGLPGQTMEETLTSVLFVFRLGIKVSIAGYSPIPGTADFDRAVASGLLEADADPLLTNNSIFPLSGGRESFRHHLALGTLAAKANRCLNLGTNPLKDREWLRLLEAFQRSSSISSPMGQ